MSCLHSGQRDWRGKILHELEPYKQQFNAHLGFDLPGTLNIRLPGSSLPVRKKIDGLDWIRIKGFLLMENIW